jgi:hypothetical protein
MSLQYFEEKKSFYQNVFLSQYLFISILCLKMSSVYKPLASLGPDLIHLGLRPLIYSIFNKTPKRAFLKLTNCYLHLSSKLKLYSLPLFLNAVKVHLIFMSEK